jgi:AraC-like DNA-binding protein
VGRVQRPAFSFVRDFGATPTQELCVDRHYLLAASRGALRLDADGTTWTLPPARAALVTAASTIEVTIPHAASTASVLFSTDFAPAPPSELAVFDLTPLAATLISECARWGDEDEPLDDYALAMFRALAEATWALAEDPSPARMRRGRSPEVRRALVLTAQRLADDPRLVDIADEVGLATRTLARRFEQELGMTWRAALRRLRILRAIEQLADTEDPVTRVAMDVGYSSLSAFETAFRDLMGTTPSRYRSGFSP